MKRLWTAVKQHDWLTDLWIAAIPFFLLWCCVVAVFVFANDYLNPPPIRRWFADRLCTPYVKLVAGFIPIYKPFDKWDRGN